MPFVHLYFYLKNIDIVFHNLSSFHKYKKLSRVNFVYSAEGFDSLNFHGFIDAKLLFSVFAASDRLDGMACVYACVVTILECPAICRNYSDGTTL